MARWEETNFIVTITALDLKKNTCYMKMLLTGYNLPWRQDIPSKKNHYSCEGCNACLNKLSIPIISLVWPWFLGFWWSKGNRVRINIVKIQWLYLYYSFNIPLIYHSIDYENIFKIPVYIYIQFYGPCSCL